MIYPTHRNIKSMINSAVFSPVSFSDYLMCVDMKTTERSLSSNRSCKRQTGIYVLKHAQATLASGVMYVRI